MYHIVHSHLFIDEHCCFHSLAVVYSAAMGMRVPTSQHSDFNPLNGISSFSDASTCNTLGEFLYSFPQFPCHFSLSPMNQCCNFYMSLPRPFSCCFYFCMSQTQYSNLSFIPKQYSNIFWGLRHSEHMVVGKELETLWDIFPPQCNAWLGTANHGALFPS